MVKLFQDTLTEKKTVIHQCESILDQERQQFVYMIIPLMLDCFLYHCF